MVKYMKNGTELEVGDEVTVRVTFTSSGIKNSITGWIKALPHRDGGDFAIETDRDRNSLTLIIYPKVEDLRDVTVVKTPDNWPPRENDVWESNAGNVYHFIDGCLISRMGLLNYKTDDAIERFGERGATLLFRVKK